MKTDNDVDLIIKTTGFKRSSVIPILQQIQAKYNYLPEEALERICEITDITPADITGVATFYSQFRLTPAGKHTIKICVGTACHVKGASLIVEAIKRHLGISKDEDTDSTRLFTVAEVACLGCCTLAPAVQIDDTTYGHLTPSTVGKMITDFLELQKSKPMHTSQHTHNAADDIAEIRVGLGSCCVAGGSKNVFESLKKEILRTGVPVRVKTVGCVGMCHQTPLVEVVESNGHSTLYSKVTPAETRRIIRTHFRPHGVTRKIQSGLTRMLDSLLTDETWEPVVRHSIDIRDEPICAFLGSQQHIASEYCGLIAPLDINEYIRKDGFMALEKALTEARPLDIIKTVSESGLRGRGGAGFHTGTKWSIVQKAQSDQKYIVMNGDEGDPGAFMDRMLLESYPFRVLEGITIAAYAIGASEGILYIRAEYPLAVHRITESIRIAEERGYLGDRILGTPISLHLRVMQGAGAFVCGEETALLESIEGKRGMPRIRPPFPAVSGFEGQPTLINNVETFASVPWIIRNGADAYATLGTQTSKGTKVFSLTGKIKRGGLIEVPMGVTVSRIVEQIGGGVANDRQFKAVQIGGPSGGCIPASLGATPIDYEALASVGAIMGSGGLVVLDDSDCMVDIARYFLQFTQKQSCGKCTFCRIGTKRMLEILDRLCTGKGKSGDIEKLEQLAASIKTGSLCGLGKTAPNPVLSTIKYFRSEYEAHIKGQCPAGHCKDLIAYVVTDECNGCTKCAQRCPVDAIEFKTYEKHEIDQLKCTRCDTCRQICPQNAIETRSHALNHD